MTVNRIIASALVLVGFTSAMVAAQTTVSPSSGATSETEKLLHVPAVDYRRDWVQLGVFSVQADAPDEGAKELHIVYAEPEAVDIWRRTGSFPHRATLVKDVLSTETEALTTGLVSHPSALAGRFVMVKDATGELEGSSPLWGDGWGWAFYTGTETQQTVTTDYRADCLSCHEPARATDLLYIQRHDGRN
jgi:Cytochrome P460